MKKWQQDKDKWDQIDSMNKMEMYSSTISDNTSRC